VSKTLSNEMAAAWSSAKLLKDAKATPETHLHRVAWRADGAALAVPLGKEVTVLSPGRGWGERVRLRGARDAHAADITVLAWSPSGRYLASGDVAGKIVVWDVDSARPLDSRVIQPDVPLCSIGWDPNRNSLVVRQTRAARPAVPCFTCLRPFHHHVCVCVCVCAAAAAHLRR
jgi:WD40 repeat protein